MSAASFPLLGELEFDPLAVGQVDGDLGAGAQLQVHLAPVDPFDQDVVPASKCPHGAAHLLRGTLMLDQSEQLLDVASPLGLRLARDVLDAIDCALVGGAASA